MLVCAVLSVCSKGRFSVRWSVKLGHFSFFSNSKNRQPNTIQKTNKKLQQKNIRQNTGLSNTHILGAKLGPIPNAKKYFPQFNRKKSQFDPPPPPPKKKKFFFFFFFFWGGGGFHLYFICILSISQNNRIQSQLLLSHSFLIVN